MSVKSVQVIVSKDLVPTLPDALPSDCLRIEASGKIVLAPNTQSKINLAVHNTSSTGRIAHIKANYDSTFVRVHLPDPHFYVAPEGKTVTYALVTPIVLGGQSLVTFDVL